MKLIENESGLESTGTELDFLNRTPLAQVLKSTINKWKLVKLRRSYTAKYAIVWAKWWPTE